MITIHLERLLKDYYGQQVRRFEVAHLSTRTNYSHHDHHDNDDHDQKRQLQQYNQQQCNNSSSSESNSDDSNSYTDLHFIMEQFLAYCSVENTLLVIGVSEAIDTIPPSLLQDFGLRKHFPIELLSPNHAYYLLKEVLSLSGLSIASPLSSSTTSSSASVSTEEEDAIRDGLLGLRIYDVATLARRIRQSKVKEYLHNNYHRGIAKDNDAENVVDGVVDYDVDNQQQQHLQSSSNDRSRIVMDSNKSRIAMDHVLTSDILTAIHRLQPIGITKVNKSNNNSSSNNNNHQISLNDIGGYKDVIRSIMNIVRNPILYERIYEKCPVKLPRALLLYGYPGCGKTYIAQVSDGDYSV